MSDLMALPASKPGRKPKSERHATAIQIAEGKFADSLPEVADLALQLALGTKPEVCPAHHVVLRCPEDKVVRFPDDDGPGEVQHCSYESKGHPANERMITYVMNRIAGTPTPAGQKQISLDFVRKVTRHIADVFNTVNVMESPDERARNFAMGVAQLWVLIGTDDVTDTPSD